MMRVTVRQQNWMSGIDDEAEGWKKERKKERKGGRKKRHNRCPGTLCDRSADLSKHLPAVQPRLKRSAFRGRTLVC